MTKLHLPLLAGLAISVLLAGAACGDDDSDKVPTPAPTAPAVASTPGGQPTTDQGQPTPTPVPDTGLALVVNSGGKQYRPTLKEFKALPQTEIEINGKKVSGVALDVLSKQVPAGASGLVTIQGLTGDLKRVGTIRFPVADIAAGTVFVVDAEGHVNVMSSAFPEAQWVKAINSIAFT